MQAPTSGNPAALAETAVHGLTAWKDMAQLVTAFGGGTNALIAIAIISLSVVIIVGIAGLVTWAYFRSSHRMKITIARIQARRRP